MSIQLFTFILLTDQESFSPDEEGIAEFRLHNEDVGIDALASHS